MAKRGRAGVFDSWFCELMVSKSFRRGEPSGQDPNAEIRKTPEARTSLAPLASDLSSHAFGRGKEPQPVTTSCDYHERGIVISLLQIIQLTAKSGADLDF